MTALDLAISDALKHEGQSQEANKAYLEFIKANFVIPIEKESIDDPRVLFLKEDEQCFLPIFTSKLKLDIWAMDIADDIQMLHLSGVDLLKGIGESVYISLNPGSEPYKEFNPAEVARMRSMVLKLFK